MNVRIIPRLDIKGPNLVKGIHFEGLRVLGKPEQFARFYYENGADELIYMDAVASLYGRNSLIHIIERTAREIFIPLAVGGGLRSVEDIRAALRAGADKVCLNTAAVKNPELITRASRAFGSFTILVSMEAVRRASDDASYEIRNKHFTREEGVALVQRFDGEFPECYFNDVMEYIGMKKEKLIALIDIFRPLYLWWKDNSEWKFSYNVR